MAGESEQKDKRAINVQISLKALVPVVPQTPSKRRELEEDLECIGCSGLLNKLWSLKDEGLVKELVLRVPVLPKVTSTLPSTPLPRPEVPARPPILPNPQVTTPLSLPVPTVPLTQLRERNLPFS